MCVIIITIRAYNNNNKSVSNVVVLGKGERVTRQNDAIYFIVTAPKGNEDFSDQNPTAATSSIFFSLYKSIWNRRGTKSRRNNIYIYVVVYCSRWLTRRRRQKTWVRVHVFHTHGGGSSVSVYVCRCVYMLCHCCRRTHTHNVYNIYILLSANKRLYTRFLFHHMYVCVYVYIQYTQVSALSLIIRIDKKI